MCIVDDDFRVGGSTRAAPLRGNETMSLLGNAGMLDAEGPRYVYGRVADEVRKASRSLTESGVRVTASVRDGYFVAWWPGQIGSGDRDGDR